MWNRAKEIASSLMLSELLKGMSLTGRFLFARKIFAGVERSLAIPANVDEDNIDAQLKDGVLQVRLPKTEPSPPPTPRPVTIKTA